MIMNLKGVNEVEKVKKDLKDCFGSKLKNVVFYVDKFVIVVYFFDKELVFFVLKLSLIFNGKFLNIVLVFFIWVLFFVKQGIENDKKEDVDIFVSRFVDNEELKYFFRLVEKYVFWVRNIFVVING